MAIITPATDGGRGDNFNRPEDPSKKKGAKVGGATVTPLTLPPLKGGRSAPEDIPEGALASSSTPSSPAVEQVTVDDIFPSADLASEDSASESLSNESSVGLSKESEEFVSDNWESSEPITELIKEGRGPGRPKSTIWNSDGYPPVLMDRLLIDNYGPEWLIWEPETLRHEILDDFMTTLSDKVFDKIMALRVCHSSQSPWREWDVFQNVCLAFNDIPVDFDFIQYISPAQIAYAIDQMNKIRKEEYGDDLKAYLATIFYEEGYVWLPDVLAMSQEVLDRLNTPSEDFKREIQDVWNTVRTKDLANWPFKEDKLGVQLSRLAALKFYKDSKLQTFADELEGYEDTAKI